MPRTSCDGQTDPQTQLIHQRRAVQTSLVDAVAALQEALVAVELHSCSQGPSGAVRLHLQIPAAFSALHWLTTQAASERVTAASHAHADRSGNGATNGPAGQGTAAQAKTYFSPRQAPHPAHDLVRSPTVAGVALTTSV